MTLLEQCITDLRSLNAIIEIIKNIDPKIKMIHIPKHSQEQVAKALSSSV